MKIRSESIEISWFCNGSLIGGQNLDQVFSHGCTVAFLEKWHDSIDATAQPWQSITTDK